MTVRELDPPAPRKRLHTRQITCEGFEREDGLFDIDGRIRDTKDYDIPHTPAGHGRPAGEPIHWMSLRITLDRGFHIVAAHAVSHRGPYEECAVAGNVYDRLAGLRIGPGFNGEVRKRFGGQAGCTHITELIGRMASTAMQTINGAIRRDAREDAALAAERVESSRARLMDSCYSLRTSAPAAIALWGERGKVPVERPARQHAPTTPGDAP